MEKEKNMLFKFFIKKLSLQIFSISISNFDEFYRKEGEVYGKFKRKIIIKNIYNFSISKYL